MRPLATALLAGAVLLSAGVAVAAERHVMTFPLSGGQVGTIEYEGDVAPRVTVMPAKQAAAATPVAMVDPFAQMDAMFAAMRQRQALMMRQMELLAAQADRQRADPASPVMQVSAGDGAPANGSFSFVSSSTTQTGTCGHSVQIIQRAGAAPQRIERSFGDCGGASAAPSRAPAAPAPPAPVTPTI